MTAQRLLDQVRERMRTRHLSYRTEQTYLGWIRRFIRFHGIRHPKNMGAPEVEAFLTHLAVDRDVSASTQNQALNALLFLYREVLGQPFGQLDSVTRARRPTRIPVVLSVEEVARVLGNLDGVHWLICCLQYGSGLRLMESVRLRVKDLDFGHRAILVRDGKGAKDRVVTLPDELIVPLQRHLATRKTLFERDTGRGEDWPCAVRSGRCLHFVLSGRDSRACLARTERRRRRVCVPHPPPGENGLTTSLFLLPAFSPPAAP